MADSSSSQRLLFYISILTFFMGVKLVSKLKSYKKIWYWTSLILQSFLFLASVYFSIWITIEKWTLYVQDNKWVGSGKITVHLIADTLGSFSLVSTELMILFRRNQIIRLTKNIFHHLTLTDTKRSIAFSRCICLMAFGYCVLIGLLTIPWRLHTLGVPGLRSTYFIYSHPVTVSFETILENLSQSFIITSLAVYLAFFKLVYIFVCRQLFSIDKYLKKSQTADLIQVCDCLCNTITVMKKFDKIFSLVPLIWFSYLFAYASDQAMLIRWMKSPTILIFTVSFLIEFLSVCLAVLFMSSQRNSLHQETIKVERHLLNVKGDSFIKSRVMANLESISSFKMTAWNMFYLEKSLLLSYIGTVMTFSILFIEKASKV